MATVVHLAKSWNKLITGKGEIGQKSDRIESAHVQIRLLEQDDRNRGADASHDEVQDLQEPWDHPAADYNCSTTTRKSLDIAMLSSETVWSEGFASAARPRTPAGRTATQHQKRFWQTSMDSAAGN